MARPWPLRFSRAVFPWPFDRWALGNDRHGVAIVSGARDNFVGGVRREEWETNEIGFNGASGAMVASGATDNATFSHSTFANRGRAIDLGSDGVTGNDSGDRDGGPNGLQNFPVLSSARRSGSTTTIRGGINSNPNTQLTVQFFASSSSEASGHGEGKRLLGKVQVQTDGRGSAGLSFATKSAPAGSVVTATATRGWYQRASGSTSEVSRALPVR